MSHTGGARGELVYNDYSCDIYWFLSVIFKKPFRVKLF